MCLPSSNHCSVLGLQQAPSSLRSLMLPHLWNGMVASCRFLGKAESKLQSRGCWDGRLWVSIVLTATPKISEDNITFSCLDFHLRVSDRVLLPSRQDALCGCCLALCCWGWDWICQANQCSMLSFVISLSHMFQQTTTRLSLSELPNRIFFNFINLKPKLRLGPFQRFYVIITYYVQILLSHYAP